MSYLDQRLNNLRGGTSFPYSNTLNQPVTTPLNYTTTPSPLYQPPTISPPRLATASPQRHPTQYARPRSKSPKMPFLPNLNKYSTPVEHRMPYTTTQPVNQVLSNPSAALNRTNPLIQNNTMRAVHTKIHKDIDDRLKLDTEKREMELLIEAEVQKQKRMNSRFEDLQRQLKDEIFDLESRYDELDTKVEQKRKLKAELGSKIQELGAETKNFEKENTILKNELLRLKDLTNRRSRSFRAS